MPNHHRVVIVGAGQGGLSVSYYLTKANIPHLVLDRGGIGHAWNSCRWDSFCLVTPNWSIQLPGQPYNGPDPDGFMPRADFVNYFTKWAEEFGAPVRGGIDVKHISRCGPSGFQLDTSAGRMTADAVVVATATYQKPRVPPIAERIPASIAQLHAEEYRNPSQVPEGAVMVVGSGQTGGQIVEDMLRAGREVYLCVGSTGRLPRFYRGRDCVAWQRDMGLLDRTPDMLPRAADRFAGDPHLTGRDGGGIISLHQFRAYGVHLVGRFTGASETEFEFGDNLAQDMRDADDFAANFMARVDAYIDRANVDAPPPTEAELAGGPAEDDWTIDTVRSIDIAKSGIRSVIWATGFSYDFSWIDFRITDEMGYPVTDHGATAVEGLYFCGLNWMNKRKSGILYGVDEDASILTPSIVTFAKDAQKMVCESVQ